MNTQIELRVPDIGDYSDVTVVTVAVQVGTTIDLEDPIVALETDKAIMEVPATARGVVTAVHIKVNDKVSKGTLLVTIAPAETAIHTAATQNPTVQSRSTTPALEKSAFPPAAPAQPGPGVSLPPGFMPIEDIGFANAHASPSIRREARTLGVDLSKVTGTAAKGRITREDVQTHLQSLADTRSSDASQPGTPHAPWPTIDFSQFGPIERKPLSRIKKRAGANLARNWASIPHVTQFDEADITDLESFRKQISEELAKTPIKLTLLAFLIQATVSALKQFPEFNTALDRDELIFKRYFHIGFAVDTPDGLVVPVLRNADQKGLVTIATEAAELAHRARDGKLKATEMQGGCFSISSLGGVGGTAFTPIINAPEVAILGVSRASMKPVWNGSEFQPRLMLPLSLSYDHRVIDGASAARFTTYLVKTLSEIRRLIL